MQTVIETRSYLAQAADLGLSEDELKEIADFFANEPDAGELVKGTGGARKARVAGRGKGKSGGYRVTAFYVAEDVPVFLLDIFSKGDKENLTKAERNEVEKYLEGLIDDYRKSVRDRARKSKSKK